MHDPTSAKFQKIQRLHRSGQMIGRDRPVGRVTWAKQGLNPIKASNYGVGIVRYLGCFNPEDELLNIRTIEIDRSIGQDAATCTISLYNVRPDSTQPEGVDTGGTRGYLTPGRGMRTTNVPSVFSGVANPLDPHAADPVPTTWGYSTNKYRDTLVPNTVIRTYQGYGSDSMDAFGNMLALDHPNYVAPQADAQLYRTGVWLIDKATFNTDGTITLECRDMAKVLIEQYIYPPLLPIDRYPLIYMPAQEARGHKETVGRNVASFHSSSVDRKYGKNASIHGHRGTHAFDRKAHSFWVSGPDTDPHRVEWLQAKVHGDINEVVLDCYKGNMKVWICVNVGGKWIGSKKVTGTSEDGANNENLTDSESGGEGTAYMYVIAKGDTLWDLAGHYYGDNTKWPIIAHANSNIIRDPHWIYPGQKIKIPYVKGTKLPPPKNADGSRTAGTKVAIPYVKSASVPKSGKVTIRLPKTYSKASYVRVVFSNLQSFGADDFRASVREMTVRNHIDSTYKPSTIGKPGYIRDWYEPIKEMCAWAGLTWVNAPKSDPLLGYTALSVIEQRLAERNANQGNPLPPKVPLAVWGDFEFLGAGPVVATPGDYFMGKSFREGIQLIADFIGAIFFIDETGGAQFRLPNIWSGGNFIADPDAPQTMKSYLRDEYPIEFNDEMNLIEYEATIDDEALRTEVLVVGKDPNVLGKAPIAGGWAIGDGSGVGQTSATDFSNVLAGQYRMMIVPGDASKLFFTAAECQRMAEMTGLMILFTYRSGNLTAPAHPALQIDDQIRIHERVSSESYVHYVSTIRTTQDLESGSYQMQVTTHWLGDNPDTEWFTNKAQLTLGVTELPAILKRVGMEAAGDADLQTLPFGT